MICPIEIWMSLNTANHLSLLKNQSKQFWTKSTWRLVLSVSMELGDLMRAFTL